MIFNWLPLYGASRALRAKIAACFGLWHQLLNALHNSVLVNIDAITIAAHLRATAFS